MKRPENSLLDVRIDQTIDEPLALRSLDDRSNRIDDSTGRCRTEQTGSARPHVQTATSLGNRYVRPSLVQ